MGQSIETEKACEGCGNTNPWARHSKKEALTGKYYEECNRCFDPSISSNPDVYFREPYWDDRLADPDDPTFVEGKGTFVRTRAHKAYLLKKLGLREAGDMKRGSRNFDPISHRHGEKSLQTRR